MLSGIQSGHRPCHVSFYRTLAGRALNSATNCLRRHSDLAVEIVSPGKRLGQVMKKISEYLEVGVLLILVVYPKRRQLVIYRANEEAPIMLNEDAVVENSPNYQVLRGPARRR